MKKITAMKVRLRAAITQLCKASVKSKPSNASPIPETSLNKEIRLKETPLRSECVTHLNRFFLVTKVFSVPKLFCGTLICPLSILKLGLKLECKCGTVSNAFPRSTDLIHVLNELPTDIRHIKVPTR